MENKGEYRGNIKCRFNWIKLMYCPNCKKEVATRWKYGMDRCIHCNEGFGKPIYKYFQEIPNRYERNRRAVEQMVTEGTISKKDLEW